MCIEELADDSAHHTIFLFNTWSEKRTREVIGIFSYPVVGYYGEKNAVVGRH